MAFKTRMSILVVLLALFATDTIYTHWQARQTKHRAEGFLADLRKLKVGQSTVSDVQRLVDAQKKFVHPYTPFCYQGFCSYGFSYDNYDSPPTGFNAELVLRNDLLVSISMGLQSGEFVANVQDEVPDISAVKETYLVEDSLPTQTTIYIKPHATPAQRGVAYSINVGCMYPLGSCTEKSQLFRYH